MKTTTHAVDLPYEASARAGCLRKIRVLMYHRVLPGSQQDNAQKRAIPEARFREQLTLLERWGFTTITFRDYMLIAQGELMPPRKPIILTFDDGYRDTYDIVFPTLREFGMRAVVFVLADPQIHKNLWDNGNTVPQTELMETQHLLEMHQMGLEIGSHSLTHPHLPSVTKEQAWEEISRSRIRLEIALNAPVRAFAYPYGQLNRTLKEMIEAAGYWFACGAWSGPVTFGDDPYEIRRIEITRKTGIAEFAAKVLGPYPAYHWLRSKAREVVLGSRRESHVSQARSLLLVSAGLGWPERREFARREAADLYPRWLPFFEAMNADILDERFLWRGKKRNKWLSRLLPVSTFQIRKAFALRGQYDVIISWAEHLGLPLAALLRLARSRTPHVALFSWISKPKKALVLKLVHRGISRIILMSSAQKDYAVNTLRLPPEKISLLRWPVDQKFWRPMEGAGDMICAVGREMRDYGTLIEALRELHIPCHIAAGGQLVMGKRDSWIDVVNQGRSLPSHISTGGMNFAELRMLYARSRFVVIPLFPTDTDNGTTSILEAMAMGKAVICSRVRGQRDIIEEGRTGLFVHPQDPVALRDAIAYLWEHPEVATEMGLRGREFIEKHHALEGWINDVQTCLERTLAEHHPIASAVEPLTQGLGISSPPRKVEGWVQQTS